MASGAKNQNMNSCLYYKFHVKHHVLPTYQCIVLHENINKMAHDRSPELLRLPLPIFFFLSLSEKNLQEFLCLYIANSPNSLIPCLLTKFRNHFLKRGHSRNISMKLFQNLTSSFREDFKEFVHVCIQKVAPIHQSHVHERIKISLTIFEKGHSRNISANWGLEATYSVVLIHRSCYCTN